MEDIGEPGSLVVEGAGASYGYDYQAGTAAPFPADYGYGGGLQPPTYADWRLGEPATFALTDTEGLFSPATSVGFMDTQEAPWSIWDVWWLQSQGAAMELGGATPADSEVQYDVGFLTELVYDLTTNGQAGAKVSAGEDEGPSRSLFEASLFPMTPDVSTQTIGFLGDLLLGHWPGLHGSPQAMVRPEGSEVSVRQSYTTEQSLPAVSDASDADWAQWHFTEEEMLEYEKLRREVLAVRRPVRRYDDATD